MTDCAPVLEEVRDSGEQLKELVGGAGAAQVEATVTKDNWRYDSVKEALGKKMDKLTAQRQKSLEVQLDHSV